MRKVKCEPMPKDNAPPTEEFKVKLVRLEHQIAPATGNVAITYVVIEGAQKGKQLVLVMSLQDCLHA